LGVPPLPLNANGVGDLVRLFEKPPKGEEQFLLELLRDRVPPGVDDAARAKAEFLARVARKQVATPLLSPTEAVALLGTMMGGYSVDALVGLLENKDRAADAAEALKQVVLIFADFEKIERLAKTNPRARAVIESWAEGEWFTRTPEFPESLEVIVYKVPGEVNTDDFSPASEASTRSDIPLHALSMFKSRAPEAIKEIRELRKNGLPVAFVGDVVGTGSSRKSAINSLIWWIGEDIPYVPNKRRGGLVIGGKIAPIFFGTARDSGALPIECDVSALKTGQKVLLNFKEGRIADESGKTLSSFTLEPETLCDEFRAGGRTWLIIGKALTEMARRSLKKGSSHIFVQTPEPPDTGKPGYTLAQKIVGRACGIAGTRPGRSYQPAIGTVGSQDTTGLMTRDELKELACLKFAAPFVLQSFCHTAAYPKPADISMQRSLPAFFQERGGVALRPGDGIIHTWLNRTVLPDTVGTGGDSHTRFPIGVSFAAGSGLVAFAAALGSMPVDMPESVLVRFKGEFHPGITLRDAVNAIAYIAIKEGMVTTHSEGKKNAFNGRIIEIEGLSDLSVDQAYELSNSSAERSAAAATIELSEKAVTRFVEGSAALLESLIRDGYRSKEALERRAAEMRAWLAKPSLLRRDPDAMFADTLEIDLDEITEPILACPNDPDKVELLSENAGRPIHEVFIGSCMTNVAHFRAVAEILKGKGAVPVRLWLCPPTRMDAQVLRDEGLYAIFGGAGARIEIPGCSLCMGNQARVGDNTTVFSTSTRNFNDRMGKGAQVYLGSAELAAVVATLGKIPTPEQYFEVIKKTIEPNREKIYKYLDLTKMV